MSDEQQRAPDAQLAWLAPLREALADLRYGSVTITVHDSKIVEIERRERNRVSAPVKTVIAAVDDSTG